MPVRIEAITSERKDERWLIETVRLELEKLETAFATKDKKYVHGAHFLTDKKTGQRIGKFVLTLMSNLEQQRNEVLGVDVTLLNDNPTKLKLLRKLDGSSDAAEFFEAENEDGQHLCIETVNQYVNENDVTGTEQEFFISALPHSLTVYKNMRQAERKMGFKGRSPVLKKIGIKKYGLSETFMIPAGLLKGNNGYFRPSDNLTRAEAATVIYRLCKLNNTKGEDGKLGLYLIF